MSQNLNGKVALVTGASRGLGAAIAASLGVSGAKVAVNYFANEAMAESVVGKIVSAGGSAASFYGDVTDEASVKQLVDGVVDKLGPIEILVINATGPQPFIKIEDLKWQDMLDQLEFFVKSPVLLVQEVIGGMKQRSWGRIINVGSEVFEVGWPEFSNYVSAKGAQLALTRSWARELAHWQITVNLVAPGFIPTERHADVSQEEKDTYAKTIPLGHMGEPADVGEAVAFLASDSAKFITGQKVSVNGGRTHE